MMCGKGRARNEKGKADRCGGRQGGCSLFIHHPRQELIAAAETEIKEAIDLSMRDGC